MNLYEEFLRLEKENSSYYYKDVIHKKPISYPNNTWEFIKEYFRAGEKRSALKDNDINKLENEGKHVHTVSMYFLGILMRNIFEDTIKNEIAKLLKNPENKNRYDYRYTWFITCLFHDFSWIHENKNIVTNYFDSNSCFQGNLLDEFNIKHNISNHKLIKGDKYKTYYSFKTIKNYFYYRCNYWKKADHGIIAGMLLYDRLVKNYLEKLNIFKINNNINNNLNCFKLKGKTWREEHLDHFAYIADSIISHNIWYGTDVKIYKKYNLEDLLKSDSNKISLKDNPLLYLLGLLDTIEPTKFFGDFNPEYIWRNIDIQIDERKIVIIISNSAIFNYLDWFNKIESLNDWLCVSIHIDKRELAIIID